MDLVTSLAQQQQSLSERAALHIFHQVLVSPPHAISKASACAAIPSRHLPPLMIHPLLSEAYR